MLEPDSTEEENINQPISPPPAAVPRSSSNIQNLESPDFSPVPRSGSTGSMEGPVVEVRKTLYLLNTHVTEPSRILNLSRKLVLKRQPPGQRGSPERNERNSSTK